MVSERNILSFHWSSNSVRENTRSSYKINVGYRCPWAEALHFLESVAPWLGKCRIENIEMLSQESGRAGLPPALQTRWNNTHLIIFPDWAADCETNACKVQGYIQNMDSTNHDVICIYHHNSSNIYMTSCSSKHMQHIYCSMMHDFPQRSKRFCSAWCMTRKVVETCQNDSSFAPVTPVDSMPSLQAVKHNAINLRLLCLAKVGNTLWQ